LLTSSAVSGVFHNWTIDEVHQFERKHPIGSKARLALALLLYTGVRCSEVVELGRQMERGGAPHISEKKGANSRAPGRKKSAAPKWHVLPILPALRAVIDATASGTLAFLVTSFGQLTAAGFGNKFRAWCNEAGLQHCSAHGLRKAGATIAAENGATETGANPLISLKGKREWCPGAVSSTWEGVLKERIAAYVSHEPRRANVRRACSLTMCTTLHRAVFVVAAAKHSLLNLGTCKTATVDNASRSRKS
jgi:hypothetical protein